MEKSIINKLLLSRRLFELARENLQSSNELSLSIGVNLLQDAVEAFLLAIAEKVNASIKSNTGFDKYFELINNKINPKELPFQPRLISLNKLRVNSKHYGLIPAKSEVDGLFIAVKEFFEEVSSSILDKSFSTLSLIDLLRNNEEKELLKHAQEAFEKDDFEATLIDCRKAIFIRYESWYDISPYENENEEQKVNYLALLSNKSPYFARNRDYIEKHVFEPTDFIVIDHNNIEMELMKSGMDSTAFWNVWRLTPKVYRKGGDGEWLVKQEFNKLEKDGIRERAEYVLDATINLFIASDQKIRATKSPDYRNYYIELHTDKIPLYEKADQNSKILGYTPEGIFKVYVEYCVPGLKGNNSYWKVRHYEEDIYLVGFISNDSLKE